jgi:colanic acid/amylovoran biosynthesis glycosyltransferase
MEAQAMAVPVLSTALDGITELVIHGETGWLVPEKDPAALEAGLRQLMGDPALRVRLAMAGADRVRQDFSAAPGIDTVAALLSSGAARVAA